MLPSLEGTAQKIKDGLIDRKDFTYRDHEARPLAEHLSDWHADLLAKGKTPKHADLSRDRAGKLIAMVKGVSLNRLIPKAARPTRWKPRLDSWQARSSNRGFRT